MCKFCCHTEFIDELEDLLSDSDFEWAEDTINGIQETVYKNEHVTKGQRDAISNIKDAVERRG